MGIIAVRARLLAHALVGLLLAGCISLPTSGDYARAAPTGIAPGEAIAVVLKGHRRPDGQEVSGEAVQQRFAACVENALHEADARLAVAGAAVAQVRYRVELWVETSDSPHKTELAGDKGGFAVARTWIETSSFRGEVFDLKHQRAAGTVTASASGHEGRGMGLVLIFPFPILYGSSTEERACKRFGEQLARLIVG